jgi:multiple sugar transport system ATP-binding protein
MAQIALEHVGKVYEDGTRAVTDLNMEIHDGEFVVFVGPSGCGKTTALRMIAGLETITEGDVKIADKVVNNVPPRDRDVAMVFQSYALYPHLSVRDNIGFGLALRKVPKAELHKRVDDVAAVLGLSELLDRKPKNLSGGQRQRVAMGRAIVRQPQAFLMDEPLSNLDAKLRVQVRAEIGRIQRDLGVTTIYVTHDQVEALTLGHRVAVIKKGVLQQIAPPQVLYDHPVNLFVAGFIGSPAMNFLSGTLRRSATGEYSLELGAERLTVPPAKLVERPALASYVDKLVIVGIRPEDISDTEMARVTEGRTIRSVAELIEPLGSDLMVHVSLDVPPAPEHSDVAELKKDAGDDEAPIAVTEGKTPAVARLNPRSQVRLKEELVLVFDTDQLHFFDPESGDSVWDGK